MSKTAKGGASAELKEKSKPLVVVTVDGGGLPDALGALLDQARPRPRVRVADSLSKGLKKAGDAPVVVLHMSPEAFLLQALRDGASLDKALAQWSATTGRYLDKARKARRRIIALDRAALQTQPERCAEILADALGLRFGKAVAAAATQSAPHPSGAETGDMPVLSALATKLLLRTDPRALALADELEAMTAVAGSDAPVAEGDLAPVFDELVALETRLKAVDTLRAAQEETGAQVTRLREERAQLRDDLAQLQDRLDHEMSARTRQAEAGEALQAELADMAARLQAADSLSAEQQETGTQAAELRAERVQLRADLEQLQDRLEHEISARTQQAAARDGLQAELLEMEARLKAADTMRAESEGIGHKVTQLLEERAQLRADLEQLQDRLEHEISARTQQAAARDGLQAELLEMEARLKAADTMRAENEGIGHKLADLTAERGHLHEELDRAREELAIIYRSNSWRVTGPLRWLRRSLSGG